MKGLLKGLIAAVIGLSLTVSSANAASCKGKSATACNASSSCSYVKGYKRKDGASVAPHCRAAKGKSTLEKKANSKKSSVTSKDSKAKATSKAKDSKAKAMSKAKDSKAKAMSKAKSKKDSAKAKLKSKL